MINRPYTLNVSKDELNSAWQWWRNLSINQMRGFEQKYFASWQQHATLRMTHQMWEEEGKPEPQVLIPITA